MRTMRHMQKVAQRVMRESAEPMADAGRTRRPNTSESLFAPPNNDECPGQRPGHSSVEVPGIEPGSSVASQGLLRAQSALPLLEPTGHADEPV
jgi:hypothetical protein